VQQHQLLQLAICQHKSSIKKLSCLLIPSILAISQFIILDNDIALAFVVLFSVSLPQQQQQQQQQQGPVNEHSNHKFNLKHFFDHPAQYVNAG